MFRTVVDETIGVAPFAGVLNEFAQVPAVGVYCFGCAVAARDLRRFLADAGHIAAAGGTVGAAAVVVAELDHHEITRLQFVDHFLPMFFAVVGAKRSAGDGTVDDVHFAGVEIIDQHGPPAAMIGIVVPRRRRIAGDEQRGKFGIQLVERRRW